ncbi:MAG: InlB B-repeat-containing protein [Candidatus Methanomethylophilaceae archaeon]|nr:InlB B-repeat-containing protein [Candidatus Methanomethylophilaceae archaeon]
MNSDYGDQGGGHVAPQRRLVENIILAAGILVLVVAVICIIGPMSSDDSDAEMIESKDLQVGYRYWDDSSHPPVHTAEWESFEDGRYIHYNTEVKRGMRLSADNTDGIDVVAEYDEASGTLYIRSNYLALVKANGESRPLKIVALCDHLMLSGIDGVSDLELTSVEKYSMELRPRSLALSYNTLTISGNLTVITGDPWDYWDQCIFEENLERYYIETGTLTVKDNASFYGVVDMEDFMDDGYDGTFDFSGMSLSELEECDRYGLLAILKTDHMVVDTNGTIEVGLERYISETNGKKLPASMLIVMDDLEFIKCNEFIIYNAYADDIDPTAHFIDDAEFISKVKSNSLTGYTPSITTELIWDRSCTVLRVVKDMQVIDGPSIFVTEPVHNGEPAVPTEEDNRFTISSYEWSPNGNFVAGQHCTLTVMVKRNSSHYTFEGMTSATIAGHSADIDTKTPQYAILTYEFTVPAPQLTASFAANGGTGLMEDVNDLYGAYNLPVCTFTPPAGKHFKAWAANNASGSQYAAGETYDVQSNIEFFAIWEQNAFALQPKTQAVEINNTAPFTITSSWAVNFTAIRYDVMNGGSVYKTVNDPTLEETSTAAQVLTLKVRAYYSATEYVESDEFVLSWALAVRTVVYTPGEGSGDNDLYYVVVGNVIKLQDVDSLGFFMGGFVFDHWSIHAYPYDPTELSTKMPGESYTISDSITIVAEWQEKTVDHLTAEYSGGTIMAGTPLDVGSLVIKLHYDDGSYDIRDINQVGFFIGTEYIENITEYNFTTVGKVTLRIESEEKSAYLDLNVVGKTVSFNGNGGEGMMPSLTNWYGSTALPTTTSYIPQTGKHLVKWALGSPGGTQYDLGASYDVTEDVTFYAIWEDKDIESLTAIYQTMGSLGRRIDISAIDITLRYTDGSSDTVDKLAATYWLNAQQIPDITKYLFDKEGASPITVKYGGLQTAMDITVVSDCVVKFDRDGGKGIMSSAVCGKNGSYVLPECGFTAPANKVFRCWSVDGAEKKVGDTITVAADVTVKAVWKDTPADEPEFTPSEVDGKKVYTNTVDEGKDTNVSTIFNTAKTNSGTVEVKVGTMNISFDSNAVNAIGGNTVSLKAEVKTTGLDVEGAQAVIEVSLDGAKFDAGTAKVTIPFANEVPSGKVPVVYFIDGDKKEKMDTVFENGQIVFTTNHFSKYAVMFDDAPSGSPGGGFPIWIVIVIVVVVLAAGGAGAFFFMKNKKA